jgi:hypothetical protein
MNAADTLKIDFTSEKDLIEMEDHWRMEKGGFQKTHPTASNFQLDLSLSARINTQENVFTLLGEFLLQIFIGELNCSNTT